jgi:KUP system potassium uptake protein
MALEKSLLIFNRASVFGALGVVYGDIGTSPLYALKIALSESVSGPLTDQSIIGAVSAIIWLLILVVSLKYVFLMLRADNQGEGGVLALLALALKCIHGGKAKAFVLMIGCCGACLFFAESVLTPAISVLSAVEGLEVFSSSMRSYILPIATFVLVCIFLVQRFGTALVGQCFGPIIGIWFFFIGSVGLTELLVEPRILQAINPLFAYDYLSQLPGRFLLVIGALALAVTGVEALYADMGHFGRPSIRFAWSFFVFPALVLNYMGQGALLLREGGAVLENPFFMMLSDFWILPAVALATLATVIASQAVISGAYSAAQQAIQLGLIPRLQVIYTSAKQKGQIYIPFINGFLLVAVLVTVFSFKSSEALAHAYGVSVTATMACSTLLTFVVVHRGWSVPLWLSILTTSFFLVIDLTLLSGCLVKFASGGWFPVLIGSFLVILVTTWRKGRDLLLEKISFEDPKLMDFVSHIEASSIYKVDRDAVYLVATQESAPQALMHNIKHNHVLHRHNFILTVVYADNPWVPMHERLIIKPVSERFTSIKVVFGFKDNPNVPLALQYAKEWHGLDIDLFDLSYFLSRETVVPVMGGGMSKWREELFSSLSKNAMSPVGFFSIPTNQVLELGTRVTI